MGSAEVGTARKFMHLSKICSRLPSFGHIWSHLAFPDLFCQLPLNQKHNSLRYQAQLKHYQHH